MSLAAPPQAVFPGSFNPIHVAHWRLAEVAVKILGVPVDFELSIVNVDKAPLDDAEIRRRLAQFDGQGAVWLTRAARFSEKAELFRGAVFIIGADTALRVLSPRYYESDEQLAAALARIQARGCRFFVACRALEQGKCIRLSDVTLPADFASLFEEIPAEQFRWDISSTELRSRNSLN
jgi:nicotinic acid mononucleotide adenylyltransferase